MKAYLDFIHSLECDLLRFLNLGLLNFLNEIYETIFHRYLSAFIRKLFFPPVGTLGYLIFAVCFRLWKLTGVWGFFWFLFFFWNHLLSHFLKSYSIVSVNI